MQTTPSRMPAHAPTPNSVPFSSVRKNSTGPVSHGRPISSAPTVGPHSRAASEMTATSTGGTASLSRRSIAVVLLSRFFFQNRERDTYRRFPQKRWMRLQASSSACVEAA